MKRKKEAKEHKIKESKIKGNSLGASGFTLSVLGVLSPGVFGILMSVLGFVFCVIQQRQKPTKLGKAGIILGIIGVALGLFWIFYLGPIVGKMLANSFPSA